MGVFDHITSASTSTTSNTAHGVNDIPAPRSDAAVNAPPPDQHKRVIDFVREAPGARAVQDNAKWRSKLYKARIEQQSSLQEYANARLLLCASGRASSYRYAVRSDTEIVAYSREFARLDVYAATAG